MSRLGVRNGFTRPKTFKSLKWKKHKIIPGAIQGKLTLRNGIMFSVVAGPTLYSLPKDKGVFTLDHLQRNPYSKNASEKYVQIPEIVAERTPTSISGQPSSWAS